MMNTLKQLAAESTGYISDIAQEIEAFNTLINDLTIRKMQLLDDLYEDSIIIDEFSELGFDIDILEGRLYQNRLFKYRTCSLPSVDSLDESIEDAREELETLNERLHDEIIFKSQLNTYLERVNV